MPTAMPYMDSPSRERKRREREVSLSPRPPGRPTGRPVTGQDNRLPSIRTILPDIPHHSTEQGLSQLRSPLRTDPAGPTRSTTLPAHLSPPPASRRPQISTDYHNGANRNSSYSLDDRSPRRSSFEKAPSHQLPIHAGPPHSRSSYSPSASGPAPVSPYANQAENRRAYPTTVPNSRVRTPDALPYSGGSGLSTSLPPPPMPYRNGVNNHAPYKAERDYDSAGYGDACYENSRNRTVPPYPATSTPPYNSMQPGYPLPPSGSAYFSAPPAHQYQNGYAHGSMQFEPEDMGNQMPRRRRGNLPRDTTDMLKQWFADHLAHPYPTEDEKQMLCRRTGLAMTQISNWFINARRRRIPELMNQAQAETRLRENSGDSAGSSD